MSGKRADIVCWLIGWAEIVRQISLSCGICNLNVSFDDDDDDDNDVGSDVVDESDADDDEVLLILSSLFEPFFSGRNGCALPFNSMQFGFNEIKWPS